MWVVHFSSPCTGWSGISVLFHTGRVRDWLPCAQQDIMEELWVRIFHESVSTFPQELEGETRCPLSTGWRLFNMCHLLNVPLYNLWGRVLMWLFQFDRRKNLIRQGFLTLPLESWPQNEKCYPKAVFCLQNLPVGSELGLSWGAKILRYNALDVCLREN